jgi:hypothetical protein
MLPVSILSPNLIAKYNIKDGALNKKRIRIAYKNGKVVYRSLSFGANRFQINKLLNSLPEQTILHILSPLDADRKYRQELKREYYDCEKAKKYFP